MSFPLLAYCGSRKTLYVVTNCRAIIMETGSRKTTIRSYGPEQLRNVWLEERKDGTGDVFILRRALEVPDQRTDSDNIGLLGIREPRVVEAMLKKLARTGGLDRRRATLQPISRPAQERRAVPQTADRVKNFERGFEHLRPALRAAIDSELSKGESVIWATQPIPRLLVRKARPAMVFGAVFTAFVILCSMAAAFAPQFGEHPFAPGVALQGMPFILVGLGVAVGSFCAMRQRAKRTGYALTDRQAMVVSQAGGAVTVRSVPFGPLPDLKREQNQDGSGDLVLARDVQPDSEGHASVTDVGFLGIADVKAVEELLKTLVAQKSDM